MLSWSGAKLHHMEGQMDSSDLFPIETDGLSPAASPGTIRLRDGETFGLRITPVRKRFGDADVRMLEDELSLPEKERIDFVSIVTPNHMHYPAAKAFLQRGFHVICDKPMTTTLEDAEALCRLVEEKDAVFALAELFGEGPGAAERLAVSMSLSTSISRNTLSPQCSCTWGASASRA